MQEPCRSCARREPRLRRLPLPGVPAHRRRRGDRSRLPPVCATPRHRARGAPTRRSVVRTRARLPARRAPLLLRIAPVIIVMKAEFGPEAEETRQVIRMAERFPDIHTELHVIRGSTRTLTEIYLLGPTVGHLVRAVRGVRGGREGDPDPRALPHDRPPRGPGRGARLRVQRRSTSARTASICSPACARSTRAQNLSRHVRGAARGRRLDHARRARTSRAPALRLPGPRGRVPALDVRAGGQVRHPRDRDGGHQRGAHRGDPERARGARASPTGVMLQIGTRNAQNFELLKTVGSQTEFPVLFKRGMGITLEESLNAVRVRRQRGQPPDRVRPARHEDEPRRPAPQLRRLRAWCPR